MTPMPSTLPAMSCHGRTVASSSSTTRDDFSSTTPCATSWPAVISEMNSRMPATNPATICALSRSGSGSSAVTSGAACAISRPTSPGSPPRSVTADDSASCCASDPSTGASASGSSVCTRTVSGSVPVTTALTVPSFSSASPASADATSCVSIVVPRTEPRATSCSATPDASGVTPTCWAASDC